jgi:hypothetical protein
MGKINQILITILIGSSIVEVASSQELAPAHGRAIRELDVEQNFKGFSYGTDEKHPNRVTVRILPGVFEGKSLIGIALNLAEGGGIKSIEPLFEQTVEAFEPICWALDAFKTKKVGVDTLWEILRSAINRDSSDAEVLRFMMHTIKSTDGLPNLKQILIPEAGPLAKAIEGIEIPKRLNESEKMKSLAEVNHFLSQ